ncbi:MAG: sigma-70 family RNA polymerase sigma factor [Planctomycetota bacterium]
MSHEPAPFPETRWSLVLAGGELGARSTSPRDAWEQLAQRYWRPVYGYIRARRRLSHEDTLDATQDFFLWMLSSGFLARADPTRGRFRGFVKVALERFLIDRHRATSRIDRGGDARILALDHGDMPELEAAAIEGRRPEDILDDLWRRQLVERALDRLRQRSAEEGRAHQFAVFRAHTLGDEDPPPSYESLAERFGVSRVDVTNWLTRMRARFRSELRREVLETVGDARELDDELRWLLGEAEEQGA